MAVQRLTKTLVDRLGQGTTVWDTEVRGFGVRRQSRSPVFVLKVRVGGRQRFFTIGLHGAPWTVERARARARSLLGAIAEGRDPASERDARAAMPTVERIAELFMADHVRPKRKRTTADLYEHILQKFVVPRLGSKRVSDITPTDLARIHLALRDRPYLANRMLAVIASMYAWARKRRMVPEGCTPAKEVDRYQETARERYLSLAELERLGAALRETETVGVPWSPDPSKKVRHAPAEANRRVKISTYGAAAIRLLLFTGARLREILHLKWDNVDFDRGLLLLPDSKSGRKTIFLNEPALEVIRKLDRVGTYVIAGNDPAKPRRDLKRPWTLVSTRANLSGVRIHDLRHSFASFGAGGGLGLPTIGKLLGHSQTRTTARYAHLDNDPIRRASEAIGSGIATAMGENNVPGNSVGLTHPSARPLGERR